ncbi:hypothetical protein ALC57_16132 [Trachymyrmex cornetzi]|uniref:Gustatory receptor n=1 Tax=Trachymyrmex cornetzi TaxID=471704 RepID=A0A151IVJ0_9HYME|nr:hypothetical protein ALC57_16132 [Trachymyrmex cornetzi]
MTETLQSALAPLLTTGSFWNLFVFEYPLGQPRPNLSCLYTLVVWSFFTCSFYYSYYIELPLLVSSRSYIIGITAIASILVSFFRFKELNGCLHELSIVDDTLEALGAPKKYQQLRNKIIRIIIGWIVFISLDLSITLYFNFEYSFLNTDSFLFFGLYFTHMHYLVYNYPRYVHFLSALIWASIIRYVGSRFHQVNDRLHVLYPDLFENNADYGRQNRYLLVNHRITGAKSRMRYIWIIM